MRKSYGNSVPDLVVCYTLADTDNLARWLETQDMRHGDLVDASSVIGILEVDPGYMSI